MKIVEWATDSIQDAVKNRWDFGSNVFDLGPGGDTVIGGNTAYIGGWGPRGTDTYDFDQGDGGATIGANGASGILNFGAGITEQQLWFIQSNNNLVIDVLGSQDSVTIEASFSGNAGTQLSDIVDGDGLRIDTGIAQRTTAMAAYQAAHPSFNPLTVATMPTDTTLQTTLAAAWHA